MFQILEHLSYLHWWEPQILLAQAAGWHHVDRNWQQSPRSHGQVLLVSSELCQVQRGIHGDGCHLSQLGMRMGTSLCWLPWQHVCERYPAQHIQNLISTPAIWVWKYSNMLMQYFFLSWKYCPLFTFAWVKVRIFQNPQLQKFKF